MDGENFARRGREFHGQVRGRDDGTEGVERGTAKEDSIGCECVNDEKANGNGFSLGSVMKYGVKVNVVAGGNLFSKKAIEGFIIRDHGSVWKLEFLICCPVEDVNGVALVDKDFLDCVVFDFDNDDHGAVLLVIEVVEVIVHEGDGRHAASVMGMSNMVDDWIWRRCFFLAEEVDPPLAKSPEMVLIVPRRGGSVGVTSVRAGWGSWLVDWVGRLS